MILTAVNQKANSPSDVFKSLTDCRLVGSTGLFRQLSVVFPNNGGFPSGGSGLISHTLSLSGINMPKRWLTAYSMTRFTVAVADPSNHGNDGKTPVVSVDDIPVGIVREPAYNTTLSAWPHESVFLFTNRIVGASPSTVPVGLRHSSVTGDPLVFDADITSRSTTIIDCLQLIPYVGIDILAFVYKFDYTFLGGPPITPVTETVVLSINTTVYVSGFPTSQGVVRF